MLRAPGAADPDADIASYRRAQAAAAAHRPRLSWARHRRPILLAFAVASFNQLSGKRRSLEAIEDAL